MHEILNKNGPWYGCRLFQTGHIDMIRDLLKGPNVESILFLGKPGVGKTTVIREMARVLADELKRRVVIVDTSNEIGGDGDIPHPAIGGARRMQVPNPSMQHNVMVRPSPLFNFCWNFLSASFPPSVLLKAKKRGGNVHCLARPVTQQFV